MIQETPANAKVSARQQCVYEGLYRSNLQQINAKILKITFSGLQLCRYLHLFSCCCPQICEILRKFELISRQGHPRSSIFVPMRLLISD